MTTSVPPQTSAKSNSAKKFRVLFVCIGNSCRSPMAESIARRDSSEIFDSISAGLTPLGVIQKQTLNTLRDNGYPAENLSSKAILNEEWSATDLVINMSGYPKQRVFPRIEWHKVEDWSVEDPYGSDPVVYQRIFEDIRTRIELLTARLRDTGRKK
jgi:arsenate reductase (thioredoxin)